MNKDRRDFIRKLGLVPLLAKSGTNADPTGSLYGDLPGDAHVGGSVSHLSSLHPSRLFSVLDLSTSELAAVRRAVERKKHDHALAALLNHYRKRYPKGKVGVVTEVTGSKSVERADKLTKHIFQWGPYPEADYGPDIDWASDPAKDIEWVASVYRFNWAIDLADAYKSTGNERYAQAFIELASDWIRKHPLETTLSITHPVYTHWKGYPWLDLQTGIRATNICACFKDLVHASAFTPQFLGLMLASLYDHQVKTEHMPMGKVHNKAIFEQRGFYNVLHTFPEFKDKDRWIKIATRITSENLLAQTTVDGVQREWCGGYHAGVYKDAIEIDSRMSDFGLKMPDYYEARISAMANHIFGLSTPELGFPMFGDTARKRPESDDRRTWQLYQLLTEAGKRFEDPKFQALADLDVSRLPANGSAAFAEAGIYALRNNWTRAQIYMALHCSPRGISSHDTPDNGCFELYAYGRWLMPDSGYFTYGNNPEARAWHRQTKVHPTLTVDGKDTQFAGRQLMWESNEDNDMLCVENQSYPYFVHRRTVWFADKRGDMPFFIILDEAIGDLTGEIEVHFPMAPGPVSVDNRSLAIQTGFDDANLLIKIACKHPVTLREEEGWHAWDYGKRERRKSVAAVYTGAAPTTFVSVLLPFTGTSAPSCRILTDSTELVAARDPFEVRVEVAGKEYRLNRRF